MKVVFVTHYTSLYGANRSLLGLIDGLKQFQVKPFVLCPANGEVVVELKKRGIPVFILPFKSWMASPGIFPKIKAPARLILNFMVLPSIVRQIRQWNVDVIYTNSSVTPIGALIAEALKKPHVWHIREFGWMDYQLQYDWGRKFFVKLVSKANAVITVSNAVKRVVLDGVRAKTYVIYNGVILKARFDALEEQALMFNKSSNYIFAIVGILHPNKGQEQAIRALAYLKKDYPNIKLLIVGSGDEKYLKVLKKLCNELEVTGMVEFWGYIPDPFEVYLKADAVLCCSKYEAMGRVTAEAMAAARPVIGRNSGGTAEIIENEVTGLLYNGEYEDLAHCMARFIENPRWAKKLGINGWQKARKEFITEIYAKRVYEVLQKATNKIA